MKRAKSLTTFCVSGLIASLLFVASAPAHGASANQVAQSWSPPKMLYETEGRASEVEVVADPFGAVHFFWAFGAPGREDSGEAQAIYYVRKEGDIWSEPVDILVSPGGRISRMQSASADSDGYLHIVWSGGNALFYSRAHVSTAESAVGWASPAMLTSGVSASEPSIAAGPDSSLVVVWTQANAGLMFVRSGDAGNSWSRPQTIFQAPGDIELARWGRVAFDTIGRLHVVLDHSINDPSRTEGRTDPMFLYYLRSDDNGDTWSEPFLITPEPDFGEVNLATYGTDTVHLVWNGRAGRHGRYHRWSQDGGISWSEIQEVLAPAPQNPIGTGGLTGLPALVTDAAGTLHMISASGGGEYYFRWTDGVWTPPLLISPGLDGKGVTRVVTSLEQPSVALSEGNQLHAAFHDGFERIWYTGVTTGAPPQQPLALPTMQASSAETVAVIVSPSPTPTATLVPRVPHDTARAKNTPTSFPILIGIAPAAILVVTVVLVSGKRRPR